MTLGRHRTARVRHGARRRAGPAGSAGRARARRCLGGCCSGASAGGRPRWLCRHAASGRRPGARGRAGGAAQRDPAAGSRGEMAPGRRNALERERRRLETAVQARTRRSPGRSPRRRTGLDFDLVRCSTSSARPAWSSWSTLTACCTRSWWRAAGAPAPRSRPVTPPRGSSSAALSCAASRTGRRPGDERSAGLRGRAHAGGRAARPGRGGPGRRPGRGRPAGPAARRSVDALPSLRDRVVSVAPSARAWLRAPAARPPRASGGSSWRRARLAAGGAEVPQLARLYPDVDAAGQGTAHRRAGAAAPSTARGSRISPRTAPSAPTARCSPRCGWTTGR